MATALGSRAGLALAYETTYGTPPATGYRALGFVRMDYGAQQELVASDLLGTGRDPDTPMQGFIDVDLSGEVPVDLRQIGFWLKLAFGNPTTTEDAGVFTHVWESGSYTLPSAAIEVQNPDVPSFAMHGGCVLKEIGWGFRRADETLNASVSLIARSETTAATSGAGSPAAVERLRVGHFHGQILRNGAPLGGVTEGSFRYANGLERIATVRGDGLIEGVDPGMAALTGDLTVRFADHVLLDQAADGAPCELTLRWQRSATQSLTIVAHAVHLSRPRRQLQGPGAVQTQFAWQAARAASPARMCTVTLVNDVEDYV
jgi:hypothetical protein